MKTNKKKATTVSLNKGVYEAAKKEAKLQRRTFSAQVEKWIEERLSEAAATK